MLGGLPVAVFMEFLPVILFLGSKSNGLAVGGCAPLDTPSVLLADRGHVVRTTHKLGSGSVPTQDKLKWSEERSLKSEPVLSTAVFPRVQTWFVSGYLLGLYTNQVQDKR